MVIYIALAVIFVVIIAIILYKKKGAKKMPQGLQTWDANGNLTLDMTTNTTKILGNFNTGTNNGSRVINTDGNTLWVAINYVVTDCSNYKNNGAGDCDIGVLPMITISNNTISWEFGSYNGLDKDYRIAIAPRFHNLDVNVLYGVY